MGSIDIPIKGKPIANPFTPDPPTKGKPIANPFTTITPALTQGKFVKTFKPPDVPISPTKAIVTSPITTSKEHNIFNQVKQTFAAADRAAIVNYENAQNNALASISEVNKIRQAIRDAKLATGKNLPITAEDKRYDGFKTKKDFLGTATINKDEFIRYHEKKVEDILTPLKIAADNATGKVDAVIQTAVKEYLKNYKSLTTTNNFGETADVRKTNLVAEEFAIKNGVSKDGHFSKLFYNQLNAAINAKIYEPKVKELYEKKLKTTSIGLKIDAQNKLWAEENNALIAQATTQGLSYKKEAEGLIKQDIAAAVANSKKSADELTAQYINDAGLINNQAEANNRYEKYKTDISTLNGSFLIEQNRIYSRYNLQHKRRIDELTLVANKRAGELAAKYKVTLTKEEVAQLTKIYGDSWRQVTSEENAALETLEKYLDTPHTKLGKNLLVAFGGAISSISTSMGWKDGVIYGDYLSTGITKVSSSEMKKWADLLDPMKVAGSTGSLIGGMLPTVVVGGAATVATLGTGAPAWAAMMAGGVAAWVGESLQVAGQIKNEVLLNTGSPFKAHNAAMESIKSQIALIPLYTFGAAPYMGKALKLGKTALTRVAMGGGLELLPEFTQEYLQRLFEEAIINNEEFTEGLKYSSLAKAKNTFLNIAPVFLLGAGGQLRGVVADARRDIRIKAEAQAMVTKLGLAGKITTMGEQNLISMRLGNGAVFTNAYIGALFAGGHIDSETGQAMSKTVALLDNSVEITKKYNLTPAQQRVYSTMAIHRNNALANIEVELDPLLKKASEERAMMVGDDMVKFINGGVVNYAVVTLPNNEQFVVYGNESIALAKNEDIINMYKEGKVLIKTFGKRGALQERLDEVDKEVPVKPTIEQALMNEPTGQPLMKEPTGQTTEGLMKGDVFNDENGTTWTVDSDNTAVAKVEGGTQQTALDSFGTINSVIRGLKTKSEPNQFARRIEEIKSSINGEDFGETFDREGRIIELQDNEDVVTLVGDTVTPDELTEDRVKEFIAKHKKFFDENPNATVGVFKMQNSPNFSIDLNVNVDSIHRENTKKFATENNQESFYNSKEWLINTGGTGVNVLVEEEDILEAAKTISKGEVYVFKQKGKEQPPVIEDVVEKKTSKEETLLQIENFGVPKEDVETIYEWLTQLFDGLKKTGLVAAKGINDWLNIEKGTETKAEADEKGQPLLKAWGVFEKKGFEESKGFKNLVESGHVVLDVDISDLAGKPVYIINPDSMLVGRVLVGDKTLAEGSGGVHFVSATGDVWAFSDTVRGRQNAQAMAEFINTQVEKNGEANIVLSKGDVGKLMSSHAGARGALNVLEYLMNKGYISVSDFRNAINAAGRKHGVIFKGRADRKSIHDELVEKFINKPDSSFKSRGAFIQDVITQLALNSESAKTNIKKIREALNTKELSKVATNKTGDIRFSLQGIRAAIGLLFSDEATIGVKNSEVYAAIKVTSPVKTEKGAHESYGAHIKQVDPKQRPQLLLFSNTPHIADLVNNVNNKPTTALFLGSNQTGVAKGIIKSKEEIAALKKQSQPIEEQKLLSKKQGDVKAQFFIRAGKNIIEAIKDFNKAKNKAEATVAIVHEAVHATVVAIIDGAKERNEVGIKHIETIVDEFNKANPENKVTISQLIEGNDAFKGGTTSEQYRAVQEFIAQSWEKYHTEGGKGFSEAFQKVLDQITEAFKSVYKSITGKELTPELRQMFDDILGKRQKETSVLVAPLYATQIKNLEEASNLRSSDGYIKHIKMLNSVAEILGLEVLKINNTIGGFTNNEGEKIIEISNRVKLNTDNIDITELYAAIVGALSHETQEATIASKYVEHGSSQQTALEVMIKVDNISKVIKLLKNEEIDDFELNEDEGIINILDFNNGQDLGFNTKMSNFAEELHKNNIKYETTHRAIESRYVDPKRRSELLKTAKLKAEQQQSGANIRNLYEEAILKSEDFLKKKEFANLENSLAFIEQLQKILEGETDAKPTGVSITDSTSINALKNTITDKAKIKIIESAQKVLKTLKSVLPNFDIVIHDREDSYNAAMKEVNGESGSRGNFSYTKNADGTFIGRIDINLSKANNRTVAHEVAHGIMLKTFGDNPALFKVFKDKISKILSTSLNNALIDFSNKYTGDVKYEEYLVELTSILEQQEGKLSTSILQQIAVVINNIISKITNGALRPFEDIKDTEGVVDFFNSISNSIRKGKEIKSTPDTKPTSPTISRSQKAEVEKIAVEKIRGIAKRLGFDLDAPISKSQKESTTPLPVDTRIYNGFNILKKKLGERSAVYIRSKFPLTLEHADDFVEFLYEKIPIKSDIAKILPLIPLELYSEYNTKNNREQVIKKEVRTPEELALLSGYNFLRPKQDIKEISYTFRKDFREGELICTIDQYLKHGKDRTKTALIFWLRKNGAETILPADELTQKYLKGDSVGAMLWRGYLETKGRKDNDGVYNLSGLKNTRQDPYGTSSMSVQIDKDGMIKIMNRYNHGVDAPDATFGGDLNSIAEGLHDAVFSIEGTPQPNKKQAFNLPDSVVQDSNGNYMVFDRELGGVSFSQHGYIKDGVITVVDKSTQRMVDDYLIDTKTKTIKSVVSGNLLLEDINKISFEKDNISIYTNKGSVLFHLENGVAKKLSGDITTVGNDFLPYNESLESLELQSLTTVGNEFLYNNESLKSLELQSLTTVGDGFLYYNESLESLELQSLTTVGNGFLRNNKSLKSLELQSLTTVGDEFLYYNESLESLELQSLTTVGDKFLYYNKSLKSLKLPSLTTVGNRFLYNNESLKSLKLPSLTTVGNRFLYYNKSLESLELPSLTTVGNEFLSYNNSLDKRELFTFSVKSKSQKKGISTPLLKSILSTINDIVTKDNLTIEQAVRMAAAKHNVNPQDVSDAMDELAGRKVAPPSAKKIVDKKETLSGIKKSLVSEKDIQNLNLENITDTQMIELGEMLFKSGEFDGKTTVDTILQGGRSGTLTPTEVIGLVYYKRDADDRLIGLYNKYNKNLEDGENTAELNVAIKTLEAEISNFTAVSIITAQQQSLAFRLRRYLIDTQYNVTVEIARYKKTNHGYISPLVEDNFRAIDKELKAVKAKLVSAQAKIQKAKEKAAEDAINKAAKVKERDIKIEEEFQQLPKGTKDLADRAIIALEKFRTTIRERLYDATLGVPVAVIDAGITITIKALKAGKSASQAIKIGVRKIKQLLIKKGIKVWESEGRYTKDISELLVDMGYSLAPPKAKVTINNDGTFTIPNKVLHDLVNSGVTSIEGMVDAIHFDIVQSLPNVTKREVMDVITRYGMDAAKTSSDIAKDIATAKRIGTLLSKLEDLQNKKIKAKTPKNKAIIGQQEANLRLLIKELEVVLYGKATMTADEKRLSSAKARVRAKIKELENRLENKDFSPKPARKLPVAFDAEMVELKRQENALHDRYEYEHEKNRIVNMGMAEKTGMWAKDIIGLPRAILAGFGDLGALFTQGTWYFYSNVFNPINIAKAVLRMMKYFSSDKAYTEYLSKLRTEDYYPAMVSSGLSLPDHIGGSISEQEGAVMVALVNKIYNAIVTIATLNIKPAKEFMKKISPFLASQRGYDGFITYLRVERFLRLSKSLSNEGFSAASDPALFKVAADFINTTTGRGSLGKLERSANFLNVALFSARKVISELKLFTPYAFWYYGKMPPALRKRALLDFAKLVGGYISFNVAVRAAKEALSDDDDDEKITDDDFWNMNSSNFMSHRFKNQTVTFGSGVKSTLVFMGRLFGDTFTDQYGEDTKFGERYGKRINTKLDLAIRFGLNKLAPIPAVVAKKADWRKGEEEDDLAILQDLALPIWLQDAGELYKKNPTEVGVLFTALSNFGAGVLTTSGGKKTVETFKIYNPYGVGERNVRMATQEEYAKYKTDMDAIFAQAMSRIEKRGYVYIGRYGNPQTGVTNKRKKISLLSEEELNTIKTSVMAAAARKAKRRIKFNPTSTPIQK